MYLTPSMYAIHKSTSNRSYLNQKTKTIQVLDKNKEKGICDLWVGKDF